MLLRSPLSNDDFVNELEFSERRRQIRQKRRVKFVQTMWQIAFISGVTGGMLWIATLPDWLLRSSNQIDIEGNRLLSQEALQKLVPLSYPQSIFQVQPQVIAAKLEATAPVHNVVVTRTLFPSKLTVQVQERSPVANALRGGQAGLLDADGSWMPLQSYPPKLRKPELTILGFSDRYVKQWASLYRQVSQSQVKISQIDWRDENNLVLTTELGQVHCGIYNSAEFAKQLSMLDQLRTLPQRLNPQTFAYIDLANPKSPILEMLAPSKISLPAVKP